MSGLIVFLHQRFGVALLIYAGALGVWGTFSYVRHKQVTGGFRSSYILMAGLAAVQGLLGLIALLTGAGHLEDLLHIVYGIFGVLFLPAMYFYSSRRDDAREAAFLTAASWIVMVAFIRGFMTGH